jgi:uncharacterized protein YbjT (DUF2867 family)
MRILLAGATGVLGRATLPHLAGHDVVGLTRDRGKLPLLRRLGAGGAVCDVYDRAALVRVVSDVRPQTLVDFLTDLSAGSAEANSRIRREGGANVVYAASEAQVSRLVVESVAFELEADAADAVAALERSAAPFTGETVVLRFGRLWGPGTLHATAPAPPSVHVEDAGADAARLIVEAAPGTYVVASHR